MGGVQLEVSHVVVDRARIVHHSKLGSPMSAMGQKQTLKRFQPMSALLPKADIGTQSRDVHFVPIADIALLHSIT
jgi:hypothetical protein